MEEKMMNKFLLDKNFGLFLVIWNEVYDSPVVALQVSWKEREEAGS